jgi:dienelactone hydrolase
MGLFRKTAFLLLSCVVFNSIPAFAQDDETSASSLPSPPSRAPDYNYIYTYSETRLLGKGNTAAVIVTPKGITASQEKLPVVIFLHAWGAMDPAPYGAWIDHIVRNNAIVIYPLYQNNLTAEPSTMSENAFAGVQAALATLNKTGPFPDPDRIAIVGHSMGGVIAANLAAMSKDSTVPSPKVLLSIEPGKTESLLKETLIPLNNMGQLPSNMLLVTMAGEDDTLVGQHDARRIIAEASGIGHDRKMMLVVHSDDHGSPPISADQIAPLAPDQSFDMSQIHEVNDDSVDKRMTGQNAKMQLQQRRATQFRAGINNGAGFITDRFQAARDARMANRRSGNEPFAPDLTAGQIDSLDWYAYWKTLDLLMQAGFGGKTADDLAADPALTDMGKWSDGTPVRPMEVVRTSAD